MAIIRIGIDTAKHVFQVHGVDEAEQPVLRRQVRRIEREVVAQGKADTQIQTPKSIAIEFSWFPPLPLARELKVVPLRRTGEFAAAAFRIEAPSVSWLGGI